MRRCLVAGSERTGADILPRSGQLVGAADEIAAGRRQAQAASVLDEQGHAQGLLQLSELAGDRRRGVAGELSGGGDGAAGGEGAQRRQARIDHAHNYAVNPQNM